MNEGHHILVLKHGEVEDWCMSESQLRRFEREKGSENIMRYEILKGKEAIDKLIEIIDQKHEEEEFGWNFNKAEDALQEMLVEVYGLEF